MMPAADPDRFFDRTSPGAHEWWYFDAISLDGRDALVVVWYAGLPFDPAYGVATLRHLRNPGRHPQPRALDHSAIGFHWYRDGKMVAYALNSHRADQFRHQAEPFAVEVATSRVERDGSSYTLKVATPGLDGRPIRAELRFTPAGKLEALERNLGTLDKPHTWILAAPDCRVEGQATFGTETVAFEGRGYHDHNAGAEDLSVAISRWEWGRVHHGSFTEVYYESTARAGSTQRLWITADDGQPIAIREGETLSPIEPDSRPPLTARNRFGIRHTLTRGFLDGGETISRTTRSCVDDGPFYRRWLADFHVNGAGPDDRVQARQGMAELLDTRNLHSRWFNWMIPYRLKRPEV